MNKKKHLIILLLLAVVFFFIYSYLNFAVPASIFNSPDETAGYFFSKLFAEGNRLSQFEPLDFVAPGIIHPRSIFVSYAHLVPGTFLGLPIIYGFLAKIFGIGAAAFFTPFFAVLAVICFYFLIRKIFDENIAFLSAVLMFFLPPFWYYAARSMFPNVLFVSLLILAATSIICAPRGTFWEYIRWGGGGLLLGLAMLVRTSEIIWVAALVLVLTAYFFKKIYWPAAVLGFVIFCSTFLPVFYQNQILYGSAFSSGYNISALSNNDALIPSDATPASGVLGAIRRGAAIIAPFGFHSRAVWRHFLDYYLKFFWWFSIPALLGVLMFLCQIYRGVCKIKYDFLSTAHEKSEIRNLKIRILNLFGNWKLEIGNYNESISQNQIIYFLSFLFISAYLFIYYGSWQMSDNINFQKITIGNSYLRYWLPIFIMGLPFAVIFLKRVFRFFRFLVPWFFRFLVFSFFGFLVFMSGLSVFAAEDEGLFCVKNSLLRYNKIREAALSLTEENSIIITQRSDKIFFPHRKIIIYKRGEIFNSEIKDLATIVPIYYYDIAFTNEELEGLNQKLVERNLRLELMKVFENEGLYKIIFNF